MACFKKNSSLQFCGKVAMFLFLLVGFTNMSGHAQTSVISGLYRDHPVSVNLNQNGRVDFFAGYCSGFVDFQGTYEIVGDSLLLHPDVRSSCRTSKEYKSSGDSVVLNFTASGVDQRPIKNEEFEITIRYTGMNGNDGPARTFIRTSSSEGTLQLKIPKIKINYTLSVDYIGIDNPCSVELNQYTNYDLAISSYQHDERFVRFKILEASNDSLILREDPTLYTFELVRVRN